MDIQDVRATTSEIGGRLSRLEDMIHKLVNSLQHPSLQHQVRSVPLGGRAPQEDSFVIEHDNDVAGEDGSALDTVDHGHNSGLEAENVQEDVEEDGDADLDFLVNSISDVAADTVVASKLASAAPVEEVPPDAVEAATKLKDAYTFIEEEVTNGAPEGHTIEGGMAGQVIHVTSRRGCRPSHVLETMSSLTSSYTAYYLTGRFVQHCLSYFLRI